MKRLAILSTHPIQYNAPLFRLIAADPNIELKVFYSKVTEEVRFDKDFGQEVTWDIPLTEGYAHESFAASESAGLQALIAGIEGFDADAVLVFGWNFAGHFAVMKHFKGKVPIWFRGDSTLIDPLPLWKRIARKLWLRYVYRHVDKALYVGQANFRYFRWCGLQESQLVYAPHAVDNEFFMKDDEERHARALEIRTELGIPKDAFVFLFVGKLEAIKQPLELAQAFIDANSKGIPDAHLIFIGSGKVEHELRAMTSTAQNIHLVGFKNQSEMPIWYRVGNVLCLVSTTETWGLAVNEAMACGCSAMVSDRVGCAEDLVAPFDSSRVLNFDNVPAWSLAMRQASADSDINRNLLAPQTQIQAFSYDAILSSIQSQFHAN
jgi:glycosyltransferase involved in cell wall biosynthesis